MNTIQYRVREALLRTVLCFLSLLLLSACSPGLLTNQDNDYYTEPPPSESAELRIKNSSDYFIKLSVINDVPNCKQQTKIPGQAKLDEGKSVSLRVKGGQVFAAKVVSGYIHNIILNDSACESVVTFIPQLGQKYILVYGGESPKFCTFGIVKETGVVDGKTVVELDESFKLYSYHGYARSGVQNCHYVVK